jgi:hypothetical protein
MPGLAGQILNYRGVKIVTGRLSTVTPYSVTFSADRSSCTQVEGAPFPLDLVIDRVESYGREWDLLYSGMTAKISVVGDAASIPARAYLAE